MSLACRDLVFFVRSHLPVARPLSVASKPLNLYPYTFDEFLHALVLPWSRNDVLSETVCALLKKAQKMRDDLVKAAEKAKAEAAKAAAAAAAAAAKRGDDEDEDEDGEGAPGTPKVEPGSSPAKSGLGLAGAVSSPASAKPGVKNESGEVVVQLTDAQPAVPLTGQALVAQTVDQNINFIRAWTAFPWHQYTMVYNVKGAPAPNPLRLKGWQASLFSAMVDLVWMLPGNRAPEDWVPGYWNIVGKMLEVVDAEEEEEGVGDMYRFEEEPEVEQAPTTVVVQPQPKKEEDVDMSVFEDEGVEFEGADADAGSEVSDDYGGKKEKVKAGKKRPAPAPIEPEFIDPTKRRRLGAGMYDESRNVTMPGVKDVVTLTQQAQQPQQLSEIIKKSHKKKAPELSFLEKCERGWKRLKIREKLAMLRFLIEEVVSSEDGVR